MIDNTQISDIVYPAQQAATLAGESIEKHISGEIPYLLTGIDVMDDLDPNIGMMALQAGELWCNIGRPYNGKSLLSDIILSNRMKMIMAENDMDRIVVAVNTEVSVEGYIAKWIAQKLGMSVREMMNYKRLVESGKTPLPKKLTPTMIRDSVAKIGAYPLYIIGHSIQRNAYNKRTRPNLSPDNINRALDYILNEHINPITNKHLEIDFIVMDYLQRFHAPENMRYSSPVDRNTAIVDYAKDLALYAGCGNMLNVQAGRQVDDLEIKQPRLADGQYTSNIEQTGDIITSVQMPSAYGDSYINAFRYGELSRGVSNLPPQIRQMGRGKMIVELLKRKHSDEPLKAWLLELDGVNMELRGVRVD